MVQAALTDTLLYAIRTSIDEQINCGKATTARKLSYCLKKVETYLCGMDLPLASINKEWVDRFSSWMIDSEKLSENTKATYLRLIYTICRSAAAKGQKIDTSAFETKEMGNSESLRALLNAKEIQSLISLNLSESPMLVRARAIWLFSLLCGGLSINDLMNVTNCMLSARILSLGDINIPVTEAAISQLDMIFDRQTKYTFHQASTPLSSDDLTRRAENLDSLLSVIAERAKLEKPLTITNVHATWLNLANIKKKRFTHLASDLSLFHSRLENVAVAVDPYRKYWFAMRCMKVSIENMRHALHSEFPETKTFIAENDNYECTEKGIKKNRRSVIRDILFFNTTLPQANAAKKAFHDSAYIYDYQSGNRRQLAIIPAEEMKMFMYINNIPAKEILYFFPDESSAATLKKGTEVTVTEGEWKGARGILLGPSKKYPLLVIVQVTLQNLGIGVSAHIPPHFLRHSK